MAMFARMTAPIMIALGTLHAEEARNPGHALVDWVSSSATGSPGKPLETAVRIRIDQGWHIYWSNPGEGGMATGFDFKLPGGWKAEGPAMPAPAHFLTGGIGSFGYEGTVLFPLRLTPPADFTGTTELSMTVSWLSCNEDACIPGESSVTLQITHGTPGETVEAAAIRDAWQSTPAPAPDGLMLEVSQEAAQIVCTLRGGNPVPGLAGAAAFPVTPQVIDSSKIMRFEKSADGWTARIGRSTYASSPASSLTLVVVPTGGGRPFQISWPAKSH